MILFVSPRIFFSSQNSHRLKNFDVPALALVYIVKIVFPKIIDIAIRRLICAAFFTKYQTIIHFLFLQVDFFKVICNAFSELFCNVGLTPAIVIPELNIIMGSIV